MSAKNTLVYHIPGPISLAADFTSPVTFIRYTDNVSYQIVIDTVDSIGNFFLEVSDDYTEVQTGVVENPGHWHRLTLSGQPVAAGADDVIGISLNQLPYAAIRLVYESTVAGTGTCDVTVTAKRQGG